MVIVHASAEPKSALEFCHLIKSIIRDLANLITIMVRSSNMNNKVFFLSAAVIVENVWKKRKFPPFLFSNCLSIVVFSFSSVVLCPPSKLNHLRRCVIFGVSFKHNENEITFAIKFLIYSSSMENRLLSLLGII
jgi:hypothetical protein